MTVDLKRDMWAIESASARQARFMRHVRPDLETGCWHWTGLVDRGGYGKFNIREGDASRSGLAHRAAWAMFVGDIPFGMHVLHRCDTPACVLVAHLFLGDDQANRSDMARKNRGTKPRNGMPPGVRKIERPSLRKPYRAMVHAGRKNYHLGYFASAEEAAAVVADFKTAIYVDPR